MFPLGFPLMPSVVLPLYLFEDRYLELYTDIVDTHRSFGVVLIERGIESQDDNRTFEFGCVARMVGSALHDDSSISIVTVGTERFRILEWLESDPYPKALIQELPSDRLSPSGEEDLNLCIGRLDILNGLRSRLDDDPRAIDRPKLADDPYQATFQLAHVAGLQPLDLQQVLEAPTSDDRVKLVRSFIDDQIELVELQIDFG